MDILQLFTVFESDSGTGSIQTVSRATVRRYATAEIGHRGTSPGVMKICGFVGEIAGKLYHIWGNASPEKMRHLNRKK